MVGSVNFPSAGDRITPLADSHLTYDEEREELTDGDSAQRNWHLVSLVSSVCSAARPSSCDSLPPRNASLLSLQTAVGSSYSAQIIFIVRSSKSVTRVTVDPITGQ